MHTRIFWGWERRNVQFKNVKDLEEMHSNNDKKLRQFNDDGLSTKAVKEFSPLFPQDSGLHFCMNRVDWSFAIVNLTVIVKTDPENLNNYLQALNTSLTDFNYNIKKNNINMPKFLCTDKMFTCNSGKSCIDYKYVCDQKEDCKDGSDETKYLCGSNRCYDKEWCVGGRCCCDKDIDLKCIKNAKTEWCFNEFENRNDQLQVNIPYTFLGQLDRMSSITSISHSDNMEASVSLDVVIAIEYHRYHNHHSFGHNF